MTNDERDTFLHLLDKKIDKIIDALPNYTTKLDCNHIFNSLDKRISKVYWVFGTLVSVPSVGFAVIKIIEFAKG